MKLSQLALSIFVICLSISSEGFATTLKKVSSYAKDGAFYAELTFDQPVSKDKVSLDYINETVQINLANITMDKSISTKVSDDKVRTIYSYRLDDDSARARIIYKDGVEASSFQSATSVASDGNKLVIRVADRGALPIKEETAAAATIETQISDADLAQASKWIEDADKSASLKDAAKLAEKKALDSKKESEIPVLTAKSANTVVKKATSTSRVIMSLGLVLGLLFGFSFFLKKFMRKTPTKKNSQVKILTQHYLGPKKSLAIIRVAGESMLIGVTDQNINLIKTLALLDEEIPQDTPKDFSKSLDKSMNDLAGEDDAEEFSFSKIKDFVSGRLKNMKEI